MQKQEGVTLMRKEREERCDIIIVSRIKEKLKKKNKSIPLILGLQGSGRYMSSLRIV